MARDCPRGKPAKQPFQGELCGWGQPLTGFWLGEAGGRPEPEKREKTEREIKTTLDNEKLQTESIGSKLSIYCELQSSMGRRLFFRRPSHTCLLSRATSCVTSNDSSKWRACSQAKIWLTSPRVPRPKQHTGDANSETINELTLKCFADPGYQRATQW